MRRQNWGIFLEEEQDTRLRMPLNSEGEVVTGEDMPDEEKEALAGAVSQAAPGNAPQRRSSLTPGGVRWRSGWQQLSR